MTTSYATQRKLNLIEAKVGSEWRGKYPSRSVDSVYNELVGDQRQNLFAKVKPMVKAHLDEMVGVYEVKMAELIERLIENEYTRFRRQRAQMRTELATQFNPGEK